MANEVPTGLANLALMYFAAKNQAKLRARDYKDELAFKQADQKLRERAFQQQVDQANREAAMQRAKPFIDAVYGPNSADTLASLQQNGLLPGFIPKADEAFKAAGMPADLSHLYTAAGIEKVPGQTVTTPQAWLPPRTVTGPATFRPVGQGAPQDLTVPAPEHIATPAEWQNPAAQSPLGPYAPPAFLQALGLGEQPVTPAGPVNVPLPNVSPPPKPILPTWKTQLGQENATTKKETAQSEADKRKADAELARERAATFRALREPTVAKLWSDADAADARGDQAAAEALRAQAQTETEAFRQKYLTAQTTNTANMPASRAADRASREGIAGANRASREKVAGASLQERIAARQQRVADAAAKALRSGAPADEKAIFLRNVGILTTFKANKITNQPEPGYPDAERQRAAAGARAYGQKWHKDLTGFGLEDYSGGGAVPAPATSGKAATGSLMQGLLTGQGAAPAGGAAGAVPPRGLQLPPEDRQRVRNYVKAGRFQDLLGAAAVQNNPALKGALLREYANVMGRPYQPRGR